ncbi:Bug family tripartite tricarboxylate transporter substrate binding protein [Hydrogenophaga sp. ANAO-22]|jgi:tripartite-type tricarboxylate transporter receptor subunit TctC|uniref:Bug family tripartite tricarboxylate transporter substrate binding protein n=1 Tax=Hydrogenophaga sp. ANAO-22 TaxID=3166645 RepID=UPI0036D215E7
MTTRIPRRTLAAAGLAALALGPLAGTAGAQDFPNRPIRIIVPFTAGGSSDVQGRLLADHLGKLYKQSVVVENRPGAGGHIGGKAVVDAPPDGYTLMLGSIGLHATYGVYRKLPYNPATDFKVLTILAEMPHVVVANEALAVTDLKSLIALGRKSPDALNFGSAGVGSSVHMIGELFKASAEVPMTHVAYKGSSAALNDLMGGQIQLMFENPPTVLAHVRNGRLKALAVTGKTRSPALPDVPTVAEAAIPGFLATSWTTVAVGAQVPDALANRLSNDIRAIVSSPAFTQALAAQGMTPVANTREAATRFVAAEKQRWDGIIDKAKLVAE